MHGYTECQTLFPSVTSRLDHREIVVIVRPLAQLLPNVENWPVVKVKEERFTG